MRGNCPQCGSVIQVVDSRAQGDNRIRRTGCRSCGFRPADNKEVLPLRFAPPCGRGRKPGAA